MKVKTSISLSKELVRQIDGLTDPYGNRSAVIEKAIRDLLASEAKRKRDLKDLDILNRHADALNREAPDVLDYQVEV